MMILVLADITTAVQFDAIRLSFKKPELWVILEVTYYFSTL